MNIFWTVLEISDGTDIVVSKVSKTHRQVTRQFSPTAIWAVRTQIERKMDGNKSVLLHLSETGKSEVRNAKKNVRNDYHH